MIYIVLFLALYSPALYAGEKSPLRGIINRSFEVVEIDTCRDAVRMRGVVRLVRGERVALFQTLGSNKQIVLTSVDTIDGGWVHLSTSLRAMLDVSQGVQLVTVASAANAVVDSEVTCAPWDGVRGGVLIIERTDTLFVNNSINVSTRGFRGGTPGAARADRASGDTIPHRFLNQSGEGVERLSARKRSDKATVSQGGGRGGARNGGGGGGGSSMAGSNGATQCSAFDDRYSGGVGGQSVALDDAAVEAVFGGGGGAGHQNDHSNSRGGNGGGIIILRAAVLVAEAGAVVRARGEDGPAVRDDGAGGGGAGGTIVIDADTIIGVLNADVNAGKGGKADGRLYTYGSGGGGSHGRIVVTHASVLENITGGEVAVVVRALPAETLHGRKAQVASVVSNPICQGEVAEIVIGQDTIRTQPLTKTSWIRVKLESASGCVYTDSVQVRVRRIENLALPADTSITIGDSIVLYVPTFYKKVLWSNGESTYRFVIRDSGWYWVGVTDTSGCTIRSDSMYVNVRARRPRIILSVDDASGRPGDYVHVVVRAQTFDTLVAGVQITGVLSSRLTLLVPAKRGLLPTQRGYSRSKAQSYVPFTFTIDAGVGGADRPRSSVHMLTYQCALGDADSSELILDSIRVVGADAMIEHHGVFRLDGVCRTGGVARLFDPWGRSLEVERVDELTLRVTTSATVMGVFDLVGRRLNVSARRDGQSTLLTFATMPAREVYLTLVFGGVVRTAALWLR